VLLFVATFRTQSRRVAIHRDKAHYHAIFSTVVQIVLDDYTVNRVKRVFTEQRNGLALFDEQLQRWLAEPLTDEQRREVERLVEQMRRIRENNANVLALADELSKGTIEKVMAKSDLELGIEALMKGFPK